MKKAILFLIPIALLITTPAFAQSNDWPKLPHRGEVGFINLPASENFGPVSGVALNSKGHLFVFHRGRLPLMEFDRNGNFVRAHGNGLIKKAHGLRIDSQDNIWLTDVEAHVVLKLNADGRLQMILGKVGDAGEWNEKYNVALFNKPSDVTFNSEGEIFVTDGYGNSRVVKFNKEGVFLAAWGKAGSGPGEFNLPHAIAIDSEGLVYVADRENNRIQIFDQQGTYIKEWTHVGSPYGLYLTRDQFLYTTDGVGNRIFKLDLNGKVLGVLGQQGRTSGKLGMPHFLHVAADESIYVAEILNWRVQKFSRSGD